MANLGVIPPHNLDPNAGPWGRAVTKGLQSINSELSQLKQRSDSEVKRVNQLNSDRLIQGNIQRSAGWRGYYSRNGIPQPDKFDAHFYGPTITTSDPVDASTGAPIFYNTGASVELTIPTGGRYVLVEASASVIVTGKSGGGATYTLFPVYDWTADSTLGSAALPQTPLSQTLWTASRAGTPQLINSVDDFPNDDFGLLFMQFAISSQVIVQYGATNMSELRQNFFETYKMFVPEGNHTITLFDNVLLYSTAANNYISISNQTITTRIMGN